MVALWTAVVLCACQSEDSGSVQAELPLSTLFDDLEMGLVRKVSWKKSLITATYIDDQTKTFTAPERDSDEGASVYERLIQAKVEIEFRNTIFD